MLLNSNDYVSIDSKPENKCKKLVIGIISIVIIFLIGLYCGTTFIKAPNGLNINDFFAKSDHNSPKFMNYGQECSSSDGCTATDFCGDECSTACGLQGLQGYDWYYDADTDTCYACSNGCSDDTAKNVKKHSLASGSSEECSSSDGCTAQSWIEGEDRCEYFAETMGKDWYYDTSTDTCYSCSSCADDTAAISKSKNMKKPCAILGLCGSDYEECSSSDGCTADSSCEGDYYCCSDLMEDFYYDEDTEICYVCEDGCSDYTAKNVKKHSLGSSEECSSSDGCTTQSWIDGESNCESFAAATGRDWYYDTSTDTCYSCSTCSDDTAAISKSKNIKKPCAIPSLCGGSSEECSSSDGCTAQTVCQGNENCCDTYAGLQGEDWYYDDSTDTCYFCEDGCSDDAKKTNQKKL